MDDEFESDIEKYGLGGHFITQWWDGGYTWIEIKRLCHGALLFCPEKKVRDELSFLYDIADKYYWMDENV